MSGIYIHIPFCRRACHYCDFHFSTDRRGKDPMVDALVGELALSTTLLQGPADTVYFGGGTPSLLEAASIARLLEAVQHSFGIAADAEVTLEANPDDISDGRASDWRAAGINRLSIGIQSFRDADLKWMNRAHDAAQALQSVAAVRRAGFEDISVDLIYGTPGLEDGDWEGNIEVALRLGVPHLSCYALTVEEGTPLDARIRRGLQKSPEPDRQAMQYALLMDRMEAAGYEHYEISSFALPGWRSRHNTAYWQGIPYLGIGPSAHSFDGLGRRWNVSDNAAYVEAIGKGRIPSTGETLDDAQRLNERVMVSLRTCEGLDLAHVREQWGEAEAARILREAAPYLSSGRCALEGERLRLTREGRHFADGIAAALFK